MRTLEDARCVLDEGNICNHCLGRRFAELSTGLTNRERGKAVRVMIAIEDDEEYVAPTPDDCWVCDGAFSRLHYWSERIVKALNEYSFDTYLVGTRVPPLIEENETLLDDICGSENAGEFKSEFNREVGKLVGSALGKEVGFKRPDVVAIVNLQEDNVEVQVNPIFVYGRYRKLSRNIPQTEWPCRECRGVGCERCGGTGYMYDTSVEELIRPAVLDATRGEEMVFHGAGREDVDALMLGSGRPFVVEVKNPRCRWPDLDELKDEINTSAEEDVEVEDLRFVTRDMVERVKQLNADKVYRMEVGFSDEVSQDELEDALEELNGDIEQRTPNRVSHRRAEKVRIREVYEATGETRGDEATIEVECEGGLYVKELVSGDEGRTHPNLSDLLGVDANVERLDVVDVKGDFVKDDYLKTREG